MSQAVPNTVSSIGPLHLMTDKPKDVDGDGLPDPIANCNNPPWGWTNGNGNPGGNSGNCPGQGGNGQGNGNTSGGPEVFEKDQYYYHPDHLGSSSYVTDIDGEIFQHLEYFPFGETWVEEHSNTQRTPYLFTAKELDEETGLYYFGARYYDPRTSVWQSPDPILGSYMLGERGGNGVFAPANLNLYGYVHQRPVIARDPDGQAINWIAGAIGAAGGAIIGGGFEAGRQFLFEDEMDWNRVGATAAGGAVAGGLTGVTMGTNLLVAGSGAAVGSMAGGTTTRALMNEETSMFDLAFDGTVGLVTFGALRGMSAAMWRMDPKSRGRLVETLVMKPGGNAPVIDAFWGGTAISVKSMDLRAASYQSASGVRGQVNKYIRSLAGYQGGRAPNGTIIQPNDVQSRTLELYVKGRGSANQDVLNELVDSAAQQGVILKIFDF